MKYLWILVIFLFMQNAKAQVMIVQNVRVSVTADSAATAREQALDRAHDLAFQKLLNENFPEKSGPLPSHDAAMNMVIDFSIDREKTTPTSYTASLTFQFNASQVHSWLQQQDHSSLQEASPVSQRSGEGRILQMKASYSSLPEWQNVKRALESIPGVNKVTILSISLQNANIEVVYGGNLEKLQQYLLKKECLLSSQKEGWMISSKGHLFR